MLIAIPKLPGEAPGARVDHLGASPQIEILADDLATLMQERRALQQQVVNTRREILYRLALAAELKDGDTADHIERIGVMAAHLARLAGLPVSFSALLRHAAPMHDVGKIGIPDSILKKPGPLTEEEWVVMRTHPTIGSEILSGSGIALLDLAAEVALTHHERFDGGGYPRRLKGQTIPLAGRIVSIVDFFDALTMDRCYRKARPFQEVLDAIAADSGTRFDPDLVRIFLAHAADFMRLKAASEAGDRTRAKLLTAT